MTGKAPSALLCGLVFLLGFLAGGRGRRFLYSRLLGYEIAPGAAIGICFIRVHRLRLETGARIGHFTFLRNADEVRLGENARIGTFNWIYGMPGRSDRHFTEEADRQSVFVMERESSLTSRHIVDCPNKVTIGAFTTVAGFRSQILTHGIDLDPVRHSSVPVTIGPYCMIGTGAILLKGASLPEGTVIGAGSTVRGTLDEPHCLYSGVPAVKIKQLDPAAAYFTRTAGPVD